MPNLSSLGCLAAELESVTPPDAGRRRTDGRTPGENRANPGFASLVLGPELSNLHGTHAMVDDIIISADTFLQLIERLFNLFLELEENHATVSVKKFGLGRDIDIAGISVKLVQIFSFSTLGGAFQFDAIFSDKVRLLNSMFCYHENIGNAPTLVDVLRWRIRMM